jgi:acetyl esterase/lipase
MLHEIIKLKEHYDIETEAYLEVIIANNNDSENRTKSPGMIVVPGGAYFMVSLREGDPIAFKFNIEGYVSFVLYYSTYTMYPKPMLELAYAIDYLRNNADKYYLDKDKIGIIGFSAGGHLVSSYSYLYCHEDFKQYINIDSENIKPNCLISCYPVITMNDDTHYDTRANITGMKPELLKLLSVENNIPENYPPTFVWTTQEDTCVPCINSELFVKALKEKNIEHEYFFYPRLDHGLSTQTPLLYDRETLKHHDMIGVSEWFNKAVAFANRIFK